MPAVLAAAGVATLALVHLCPGLSEVPRWAGATEAQTLPWKTEKMTACLEAQGSQL